MDADRPLARIRSAGRITLWLVLAILLAAGVYTASIALLNWPRIGV